MEIVEFYFHELDMNGISTVKIGFSTRHTDRIIVLTHKTWKRVYSTAHDIICIPVSVCWSIWHFQPHSGILTHRCPFRWMRVSCRILYNLVNAQSWSISQNESLCIFTNILNFWSLFISFDFISKSKVHWFLGCFFTHYFSFSHSFIHFVYSWFFFVCCVWTYICYTHCSINSKKWIKERKKLQVRSVQPRHWKSKHTLIMFERWWWKTTVEIYTN